MSTSSASSASVCCRRSRLDVFFLMCLLSRQPYYCYEFRYHHYTSDYSYYYNIANWSHLLTCHSYIAMDAHFWLAASSRISLWVAQPLTSWSLLYMFSFKKALWTVWYHVWIDIIWVFWLGDTMYLLGGNVHNMENVDTAQRALHKWHEVLTHLSRRFKLEVINRRWFDSSWIEQRVNRR